jgi:hypothetical protein
MTTSTGRGTSSKKRKTEAPGQALGIGLQYTRLLQLLQAHPGSACSMEYLDDVAQEDAKHVKLDQRKSALTAMPLSKTKARGLLTLGCRSRNLHPEQHVSRSQSRHESQLAASPSMSGSIPMDPHLHGVSISLASRCDRTHWLIYPLPRFSQIANLLPRLLQWSSAWVVESTWSSYFEPGNEVSSRR